MRVILVFFALVCVSTSHSKPSDSVDVKDVVVDKNGVAYILDKEAKLVHRYDSILGTYLAPMSLKINATTIAYSKNHERIYLDDGNGRVYFVETNNFSQEVLFVETKSPLLAMVVVNEYLYLVPHVGTWVTAYLYSKDGKIVSAQDWTYGGEGYQTDGKATYFTSIGVSPPDIYKQEITSGKLQHQKDTPFHGGPTFLKLVGPDYNYQMARPVAANSSVLVLSDGHLLNVATMDIQKKLNHGITSALFLESSKLVAVTNEKNLVLRFFDNFVETKNFSLPGNNAAIIGEGSKALLVYEYKDSIGVERLEDIFSGKVTL
ncbi:MAG: hypothetical protein A4S09_12280 [Proteobacteria bacterium SG_bin7]|nr:MAG: hypothetical protein A4S09_12280 [Proteobacteria bacterium SG_bin7]